MNSALTRLASAVQSLAPYQQYICDACGYIYDEAQGDPDGGLPPGTRYADIPDDWACPLCGAGWRAPARKPHGAKRV